MLILINNSWLISNRFLFEANPFFKIDRTFNWTSKSWFLSGYSLSWRRRLLQIRFNIWFGLVPAVFLQRSHLVREDIVIKLWSHLLRSWLLFYFDPDFFGGVLRSTLPILISISLEHTLQLLDVIFWWTVANYSVVGLLDLLRHKYFFFFFLSVDAFSLDCLSILQTALYFSPYYILVVFILSFIVKCYFLCSSCCCQFGLTDVLDPVDVFGVVGRDVAMGGIYGISWVYLRSFSDVLIWGNFHFDCVSFEFFKSFFFGFAGARVHKFLVDGPGKSISLILYTPNNIIIGSGLNKFPSKLFKQKLFPRILFFQMIDISIKRMNDILLFQFHNFMIMIRMMLRMCNGECGMLKMRLLLFARMLFSE